MRRIAAFCFLVTALTLPCTAFAGENYAAIAAGIFAPGSTTTTLTDGSTATEEYEHGFAISGAVGTRFDFLRVENELAYRKATPDAWAFGWLINFWIDGRNSTPVTPYFGGGLGFGTGHAASPGMVENDISGLAYQAGAGIAYGFNRKTALDVGYRFFGLRNAGESIGANTLSGSTYLVAGRFSF